jgi:NAD(P)-dependent dehydrogenase (short-subunit alcohol dehydrogenase family)
VPVWHLGDQALPAGAAPVLPETLISLPTRIPVSSESAATSAKLGAFKFLAFGNERGPFWMPIGRPVPVPIDRAAIRSQLGRVSAEQRIFAAAAQPVGHMGEMSDVVDAILYLDSASFVTGEILHVDGGQSAGH